MNCSKYPMVTIFNDNGSNVESELNDIYQEKPIPIVVIYWPGYSLKYLCCLNNANHFSFVTGIQNKDLIES